MNEPLVCEDTNLDRLLTTIRTEHGESADILYQDSVRRGGVMGFFAQEVHRVVYRVCEAERGAATSSAGNTLAPPKSVELSHDAVDMHPFEAMLAEQTTRLDRPDAPAAARAEPAEIEMPWLDDLLAGEPTRPVVSAPPDPELISLELISDEELAENDEPISETETRIVAYAFPRAEPTTRPFKNKPQALDELINAADDSENAMSANLEGPPVRMTAQERFAELLAAMDESKAGMIVDDTTSAAPIKTADWPTIEDEPAEQSHEPFRIAHETTTGRHATREPDVEDVTSSPAPIALAPVRENAQVVSLPTTGTPDARARMDMMTRLREVGVPSSVSPSSDAANIYEALEEILSELPATPTPPRKPGDVLVIIGEIGPSLRAAQSVARTLRLRDADIWVADLESHPVIEIGSAATTNARSLANPRHAARVRAELVQADVASVIVVATDGVDVAPNDPWIGEMLEALRPTAVWASVDATRKPSDTAARLALLGDIDALAVHSAAISSSPASVWEIGIPVALLDGRTAGVPTWAGLLLGLLSADAATAETTEESESRHSRAARHRSA